MPFDAYFPTEDEVREFTLRYAAARASDPVAPEPRIINGRRVVWSPLKGAQERFLNCPLFEVLFHGNRGPGKTDALLMSFAQHVGKGFGPAWTGIIFRQTYPQLADVTAKSQKWFKQIWGDYVKFNKSDMCWTWSTGEKLYFRHINTPSDYWKYHGHEYPFIGWEEVTNWADDECYRAMMSCCRCSTPGVPRMIRATTNPYGPGHNWVKLRFNLAGRWWLTVAQLTPTDHEGRPEPPRAAIHGDVRENTHLLAADPNYVNSVIASAANPAMAAAWLRGDWDIVAGGLFDDVWRPGVHIVTPFRIPTSWRIDRSFDWGSSSPFSVGWWAESDGSDALLDDGSWRSTVRGDLFRIGEWYGWTGKPNDGCRMLATDIAAGIREREERMGFGGRVVPGPADTQIFDAENGNCIATDMAKKGVTWSRADKSPGSRKTGWEQMRIALKNSHPSPGGFPREDPGLFVFSTCDQFIRTVPPLPRSEKDMDEAHELSEDHAADETRYRLRFSAIRPRSGRVVGLA